MVVLTELLPQSSSSSHNHIYNYDVFLSFRGPDTRNRFTDHLYNALVDAGIVTFLDDEEIETGEPLKPELENAIKSSRASIIVLSKNYASSIWCLDELVLILDQKLNAKQIVIPIFYDVDPIDIMDQQSGLGEAMAKHKQTMEADKRSEWDQKIELWKIALAQVADLKGKDAKNKKETNFIKEVVTDIHGRLHVPSSNTLPRLIGMESYITSISSWLIDGSCHTSDILTIVGIGGIGKTSLARYVFGLHSTKFKKSIFIEGIDAKCKDCYNGLLDLQKQLCGDISKYTPLQVHDVSVYTSEIENALAHKKVLLVLDDIGCLEQLDALLGNKAFQQGSKIIITTKDASLTERCALFNSQVKPTHKKVSLNGLYESVSLELLCIHAFKRNKPEEGYEEVSKKLVKYCKGHPLALELLGRSVHKRDVAYWENCIKVLKKEPHTRINKALKMSFDSLPFKNDKELFKHIACFFVGIDQDVTIKILDACGINTRYGITNLIDRCLVSIGCNNQLIMHQLVQEMGRDLVRQESPEKPWKRSRLSCHEESFKVLKQEKGKGNLLGLALDTRMLDKKMLCESFELKTSSFSQMDNLMLLQLNYVQVNGCFENFPKELRWLCMHGSPLKSIPLDLPMENLVVLDMSYSNIEYFDMSCSNPQPPAKRQKTIQRRSLSGKRIQFMGPTGSTSKDKELLGSLKILDLSFCEQLHSAGGFYKLPGLERLIVRNCISLIEVCESVEQCVELVHIDMSYCYKLKRLPMSIGNLKKVKTLLLDGCNFHESQTIACEYKFYQISLPRSLIRLSLANSNLRNESFPMDLSCLVMLEELCLDNNPIVSMPDCVRTLPRLQTLYMDYCDKVISIEHPPRTLREISIGSTAMIRKIKFDAEMSPIYFRYDLGSSSDIDGITKIQPMADVDEKVLQSLGWKSLEFIKEMRLNVSYIYGEPVGSVITKMSYEFGIFSTIYLGEGMPPCISFRNESASISVTIPSSSKKLKGLNFCCNVNKTDLAYKFMNFPVIKVNNITRNLTWIYKHYICGVKVDGNSLVWLSHWMVGPNEMKGGDHITVTVAFETYVFDQVIKECGIGFVYEEAEEEEDALRYYKSWNHIIGGDLSRFKTTRGEYFLDNKEFLWASSHADVAYNPFTNNITEFKEDMRTFKAFAQKKSPFSNHRIKI